MVNASIAGWPVAVAGLGAAVVVGVTEFAPFAAVVLEGYFVEAKTLPFVTSVTVAAAVVVVVVAVAAAASVLSFAKASPSA